MNDSTFDVVAKACRYNSGKHMLDSGGDSGRHWQKPGIDVATPVATFDASLNHGVWGAAIETAHFIAEHCEIHDLQASFDNWAEREENSELSWFEVGENFMEENGYSQVARDNTYNSESDLTQCYVWEVWVPGCQVGCSDWIYADNAVLVCYFHTGADVRGGYSYPVFMVCEGEYTAPLDFVASYCIGEARIDGVEVDNAYELSETWQAGYTSYPFGEVENAVERWFMFTLSEDKTSICAKLKSGELVKIYVEQPYV